MLSKPEHRPADLAPVVLFTYNRLEHTQKTVTALQQNFLAPQSDLIIYSDGWRSSGDRREVERVREYLGSIKGFKTVNILKRSHNRGLADSIITGVSEVIGKSGRAIVLEDDLLTAPLFLTFMNEALTVYQHNRSIWSIGGYNFPLKIFKNLPEQVYLTYRSCSWGWGTWADRWEAVDWGLKNGTRLLTDRDFRKKFNRAGSDMSDWLKNQIQTNLDSWAVKWDVAHCLHEGYCLRPVSSLVQNIGFDGSGVHCGVTNKFDVMLQAETHISFPETITIDPKINKKISNYITDRWNLYRIIDSLLRFPLRIWNRA